MTRLKINDQEYEVPDGLTMLQAARYVGIEIPVFCYHDRLAIAGNCRMCLVEMDGSPKPVASCAMPIREGLSFRTQTAMTAKARKNVLEFLLINHPLDCPICDQAGECDLQDITMAYGPSTSRFQENKRAVSDKPMGPLIKTFMNRCIHCTRCIRFTTDVAGTPEMGAVGRGENMEVLSYLNKAVTSELSGNVIDLCPVGALTSKPYAFTGRPWELVHTESIDVMDALGSAIRIDTQNLTVMRILPRLNEGINEEWLSDKSRYACDSLTRQRLDQPYVRNAQGRLQSATWIQALDTIADKLNEIPGHKIAAIAGDMVDVEAMVVLKDLLQKLGSDHLECRQDGSKLDSRVRVSYLFNTTIAGLEQSDFCLIINANLRCDAPLIAARLRKKQLQYGLKVAYLGGHIPSYQDLTVDYQNLGNDPATLDKILSGQHPICHDLKAAINPCLILGTESLCRTDGAVIINKAKKIADDFNMVRPGWNGFNILHKAASRVGGLDIGFTPRDPDRNIDDLLHDVKHGHIKVVYLLAADEIDMTALKNAFVIYQGHHGDRGAAIADVILPGAAYTEKDATYVNTEGRPQQAFAALAPPGQAQIDWQIIVKLAERLNYALGYTTHAELLARMGNLNNIFQTMHVIQPAAWQNFGTEGNIDSKAFAAPDTNFYMNDSISRHSITMAKCVEEIVQPLLQQGAIV